MFAPAYVGRLRILRILLLNKQKRLKGFARFLRPTYAGANMGRPSSLFGPGGPVVSQTEIPAGVLASLLNVRPPHCHCTSACRRFCRHRLRRKSRSPSRSPDCRGNHRTREDARHSPDRALARRADDRLGRGCRHGNRASGCVHSGPIPFPPLECRNGGLLRRGLPGLVSGQQGARLHLQLQCPGRDKQPSRRLFGCARGKRISRAAADPSAGRHHQPGFLPRRAAHCLPIHSGRHPAGGGAGSDEAAVWRDRGRGAGDPTGCGGRGRFRRVSPGHPS